MAAFQALRNMAKLGKQIESAIKKFAEQDYPKESCGVITKSGKKLVAIRCENVADNPEQRFVIATEEYRQHIDNGEVYGIWHSHVNESPEPSVTDIAACNATGVDWFIISINLGDFDRFYFSDIVHVAPQDIEEGYLERPYIYGIKDCFTLARDYYQKEFSIAIDFRAEGYPELLDWEQQGINMLVDSYKKAGFVSLLDEEAIDGDLFLIKISPTVTDHIAVYIGDDRILHHCMGRLSRTDVYGGGFYQKHTTHHLRHQSFMEKAE